MILGKHDPVKVYSAIRFASALLFSVIVTVNLVYQATVVGLNPLQLVLVGTVLETVSFLFEVPTGIVADVYSRKLSVIIGLLLIGLGFTVEGLFPSFAAILVAQVIWGIGFTFVSGAREAWIADEIGEDKAGKAFSKGSQMSLVGSFIGIAISMALANINIRLPIILGGVLYSCQSIYLWLFMPENNFHPTPIGKRETFGVMKETLTNGIKLIKASPVLLTIILAGLIFGIFSEGFDRLWTPFMINNFSFPEIWNLKPVIWFGILAMIANALAIVAVRLAEKKTDTNNHKSTVTTLLIVNGILAIVVMIFGLSGNFVMAAVAYWMVSMFREARGPIYDAWTNQNLEPKVRATVFSMCSQANAVGQIVGGPLLGFIATAVSLRFSFVLAGMFLIPSLLLYTNSIKNHKMVEPVIV
ncbi:MFS transporter [Candidatus Shapirobacteria bacterium]|nr:MFS transporter [Candidatus Shapirobacteria bacterium]